MENLVQLLGILQGLDSVNENDITKTSDGFVIDNDKMSMSVKIGNDGVVISCSNKKEDPLKETREEFLNICENLDDDFFIEVCEVYESEFGDLREENNLSEEEMNHFKECIVNTAYDHIRLMNNYIRLVKENE